MTPMHRPPLRASGIARLWRGRLTAVAMAVCSLLVAVPLVEVATAPAAGASVRVPVCPPDCGFVAAGDPLLIPFVAVNPGLGWLALPAADVQSYARSLEHNLAPDAKGGVGANVAAARWAWTTGRYDLLMVLVSSNSLARLRLGSPARNALDLCASAQGEPLGRLKPVTGVPSSVTGLCAFRPTSSTQGATVVAFNRANVAVIIEITSRTGAPIASQTAQIATRQQYLALPAEGVPVSSGLDVEWVLFWLCLLIAIAMVIVLYARRRGNWRAPLEAVVEAFGRRKIALGVSLLAVIGTMAFAMLDSSLLHGSGQWFEASYDDFWRNWADAAYMTFAGGYGHIYVLDGTLETAPAFQLIAAPVARAAFGLWFPYPSQVLYPTAFWVAGPLFLSSMALPICAADRWLQYLGVTDLRRRLTVLGAMAITLPPIALDGHPEDLIALGAMLYGLVAALNGRHRAVGWWLGTALAFQFFAFLAVPMALVFLKRRRWLGAMVPMVALPAAVLIVPLISEPSATVRQLIHQKVFYDFGYISPTWNLDPGVAAYIRGAIVLVAIPAALVLARFKPGQRRDAANLVVWTLTVLFALRVFEPELVPYFLAPALALSPVSASRGPWWRLVATSALAVWLNWWVHIAVHGRWSSWVILVAQLVLLGWLAFPRPSNRSERAEHAETKPARMADDSRRRQGSPSPAA